MFTYQKAQVIKKFQLSDLDTGSSEVQVALLSYRIKELTEHFKIHKKDAHGRMGLIKMVSRRKRLLTYLRNTAPERYQKLIDTLELRK